MNAEQAIRYPRGERIAARLPPEVVDLFTGYSLLRAPPTALVLAKLVREQRVGLHRGVLTEAGRDLDVYLTIKETDDRRARADARNASAPSPAQEPHTTATGGGATSSAKVREALRARLTAALEQLDVVADHALPVFAEGVALGLCRDAGLPPTVVVPVEELDPVAMIRRWADQEDSCRDR